MAVGLTPPGCPPAPLKKLELVICGPGRRIVSVNVTENVPDDAIWRPRAVLTNETGTVAFTDSSNISTGTVLYRARILD